MAMDGRIELLVPLWSGFHVICKGNEHFHGYKGKAVGMVISLVLVSSVRVVSVRCGK